LYAIHYVAQTTFQVLLAVPVVGAALIVALILGADLAKLLQGSLREMFGSIANALVAEPVALFAFVTAFLIVLVGGSILMFLVKGGTIEVLRLASDTDSRLEHEPITLGLLRSAARFTLQRYMDGSRRLFRRYFALGLGLMVVYAVSGGGYLAVIAFGFRAAGDSALIIGFTVAAAAAAGALVVWITAVNLVYLLLQIAIAVDDVGVVDACRGVARFVRTEFRELGGIFLVVLAMVIGATFASALAWSGVGLIAFVPLVGLAVFPLQILALLMRGLVFEYIGLTAVGAYLTLYCGHASRRPAALDGAVPRSSALGNPA
jgi:hypothetical protein